MANMVDNLGSNLDQLLPLRGWRPALDYLRQRKGAQVVAEIVGQRMNLEPVVIVAKPSP